LLVVSRHLDRGDTRRNQASTNGKQSATSKFCKVSARDTSRLTDRRYLRDRGCSPGDTDICD